MPPDTIAELVDAVAPVDDVAHAEALQRHDRLAKPPGSLGRLEPLGARLAAISGRCPPPVPTDPAVVLAAGDHGVHVQGVTPWPQQITATMVETFCQGRATINAFAEVVGARVAVLDVGVAAPVADHPRLRRARVRDATRDMMVTDAMTDEECVAAVLAGAELAGQLLDDGCDLLVTGDMGIANTTASAALIAAFTGLAPEAVTGRGTGIDDAMHAHKTAVVTTALARHGDRDDPLDRLASLGGFEHAALVGVILAGAGARAPVLLDGVTADAAALAAVALAPDAAGCLVAGHRSAEPGADAALAHLGLDPLLDLDLRLGEGTGALLAVPLLRAAAAALTDVATLSDLGVAS